VECLDRIVCIGEKIGMNRKKVIVIFAKWPEFGKTKTRIGKETTPDFALEFTHTCLKDTLFNLNGNSYYDLLVAVDTNEEKIRFQQRYGLEGILTSWNPTNKNSSQSEKLNSIFYQLLSSYEKVILIPMDVPFLTNEEVVTAFTMLGENRYVFGREFNGGVYLIGMRAPHKNIFDNVQWSTMYSARNLERNISGENTFWLKEREDFNTVQDLINNLSLIRINCPNLYALLKEHGYDHPLVGKYVNFDEIPINIPVVNAIVEREGPTGIEILMQERYKPNLDVENTGKLEIPGGILEKRESACEAVLREVEEETGLKVKIKGEFEVINGDFKNKKSIGYRPFSCSQQLEGDRAYIGLNFLCEFVKGELRESRFETRNPRWVSLRELDSLLHHGLDRIFSFNIPTLRTYLSYRRDIE